MSDNQDVVYVRNLTFDAIIGVLPRERTTPQPVCISLDVVVDTQAAADSTDLQDTLDYAALADQVKSLAITSECLLVETLAQKIAELTLQQPLARAVTVDVTKPNALQDAEGVGVRIHRSKA